MKRRAAAAALAYVRPDTVLGVGSGSTAAAFVEQLAAARLVPAATIPSSQATAGLLRTAGLPVVELVDAPPPTVYVDGADQADPQLRLLKGRGGAQTREKLLATVSPLFVCIVDERKLVDRLGDAPVPIEVLPAARLAVAAALAGRGAEGTVRERRSDDGNLLMDVTGLDLEDPDALEAELQALPGVLACGIFARRRADVLLCGRSSGAVTLTTSSAEP